MKLNNYDKIAKHYDSLSRLVFFNAQVKAQKRLLQQIPENSKVLIVGGGTGWILDEIAKSHLEGLEITYVEISENMLQLARKRNLADNKVEFIHLPVEEFVGQQSFDVILTAFLFDNFAKERIQQVFSKLKYLLKPGGLWLFTDFVNNTKQRKIWQSFLLKSMYAFFNKIANVEAKMLVDMDETFEINNFKKLNEYFFYGGFIKSVVYQKVGS